MRKALIAFGIVIVLGVAAAAALLLLVDVNQFRPRIQTELQQKLGRPVTLGAMSLHLLPLSIRIDDVKIGESPAFPTGRPFATAKQLRVSVDLLPLLRKEVRVDSLRLLEPAVELVQNSADRWNYSDLGGESGSGGGGLAIQDLRVENGQVAVSRLGDPRSRSVYDRLGLNLTGFAPGKEFQIRLSADLPDSGKESLTLDGKSGPSGAAGRLTLRDASLAGIQRFAGSSAARGLDGAISGAVDVATRDSVTSVRGGLDLKKARVRGADLGYPVRLDIDTTLDTRSGLLKTNASKLTVGRTPILISGQVDTKGAQTAAILRLTNANLDELLAIARAFGAEGLSGSGVLSLDARIQGTPAGLSYSGSGALRNASIQPAALTKPIEIRTAKLAFAKDSITLSDMVAALAGSTLRGNIAVRNFNAPSVSFTLDADALDAAAWQRLAAPAKRGSSGANTPLTAKGAIQIGTLRYEALTLNQVRAECTLDRGVLTLTPLTAELFGGKQTGSLTVDTRGAAPTLALNAKLDGVDADRLLSATTSLKKTLYGLLAASGDASLSLAPGTELARTLNGNLNVRLNKGRLAGVNVLNEVANLGKFLGYTRRSDPFTNIVQLTGDLKIRDGVASTDNLQLQIDGGTLSTTGSINLADQSLNLRLLATLDRATSQKAGGTQIGGFLTTALANNQGELVIPSLVTGTFAHPRFLPDAARMAEMRLGALGGGKGAAQSILDSLSGGKKPANAQPTGNLLDLVDALRGKKEPKK